jgi:hypothetical protein
MLLNATQYSGKHKKEEKVFSASMLGDEPLKNYLRYKHGTQQKQQLDATTLGSLYQLGIDTAVEKWNARMQYEHKDKDLKQYEYALRMTYILPNGWTVSGEIDQYDTINNVIFDNKLSNETTFKAIEKEGKRHHYALQLAVYKWLLIKNNITEEEPVCSIALGNKSYSHYKTNKCETIEIFEVPTLSIQDTELLLIEKTNELQTYIDMDTCPEKPVVNKLMPYKKKGSPRATLMKCEYYCDYKDLCPHYQPNNDTKSFINNFL